MQSILGQVFDVAEMMFDWSDRSMRSATLFAYSTCSCAPDMYRCTCKVSLHAQCSVSSIGTAHLSYVSKLKGSAFLSTNVPKPSLDAGEMVLMVSTV